MFGGDRLARELGDKAFYSLPGGDWAEIDAEAASGLRQLAGRILQATNRLPGEAIAADVAVEAVVSPMQLAFLLFQSANDLWTAVAPEDHDLRQVISTLRTALAVCWDTYNPIEAETATVTDFMGRLRDQIEEFERDLLTFDAGSSDRAESAEGDPSDQESDT